MSEWTQTEKYYPKNKGNYLVTVCTICGEPPKAYESLDIWHYNGLKWREENMMQHAIAWMPLPDIYREEKQTLTGKPLNEFLLAINLHKNYEPKRLKNITEINRSLDGIAGRLVHAAVNDTVVEEALKMVLDVWYSINGIAEEPKESENE